MEPHFPEQANYRLMNLMTIARNDQSPENDQALIEELQHGNVMLLVPAEPPDEALPPAARKITFTHVIQHEGQRMVLAFTSETALRGYAKDDTLCMGVPAHELLRVCMGKMDAILLDAMSPNEVRVCLTPFAKPGEQAS